MTRPQIEDIYPLSPMQRGMLFHTLYAPESDIYFEQYSYALEGDLNVSALIKAWTLMVERHQILRTAFAWEGLDEPVQVVSRTANLPFELQDWRGLSHSEQAERLEIFLRADRERGFDLALAPLIRLTLIQLADNSYQLVWDHHHLLLDAWGGHVLSGEVYLAYGAYCHNRRPQLGMARPFRDYIAWLKRQDFSAAEVFWRKLLKGFTAPTDIGADREDRTLPYQLNEYAQLRYLLSAQDTAALKRFAAQHQLTLSTILQAAWALLLNRYSNQEDVLFGIAVTGRSEELAGSESIVGMLMNTLPVRVSVPSNQSVVSWLRTLQEQQVESYQYQHAPLLYIQSWSELPKSLPLFESILVVQNLPPANALEGLPGGFKVRDTFWRGPTNFPLSVMVYPYAEMEISFAYYRSRFDEATIARMKEHFTQLLKEIVAEPHRSLSYVSPLTSKERHFLLVECNRTALPYPTHLCLHHLFEQQVRRSPHAIALSFSQQHLSYAQLNSRANHLAQLLRARGVGPESVVAVLMERSLELVVALLAILKAGGAYLPLEPESPRRRQRLMVEEAGVKLVLTQGRWAEAELGSGVELLEVQSSEEVESAVGEEVESGVGADNLAYVIYTSGSTGLPKAAMNTHRAISNRLLWMQQQYGLDESDVVLQKTPFSFDVSVWEFFWPLMTGARLVVAEPGGHRDTAYLREVIWEQEVTTLHFVPSMLEQFLEEEGVEEQCGSVRRVMSSGEELKIQLRQRFYERMSGELHNLYGPTEAAIDVTSWKCEREPEPERKRVPIGRPIANTEIYLLDAQLQPVPVGVAGELHIGGVALARGYLHRPELTAESFIPHPFSQRGGERLYRTGDVARYLAGGEIEYLGRADQQVKVRGHRIELGEVEAVLRSQEWVRQAIVVAEAESGGTRLIAYLVLREGAEGAELRVGEIREYVGERLPEYMIPGQYVEVREIPVTGSGKVDRRRLREGGGRRLEGGAAYVEAGTEVERELVRIWGEVLGVERVGVRDNFFELGGDSLMALRVVSQIRAAFRRTLPLRALFESQTIARLATHLEP